MRIFQSDGAAKGHPRTPADAYGTKVEGGIGSPVLNEAQLIQRGVKATATQAPLTRPTITTHPQSISRTEGNTANFTVVASGVGPFTYQWKKNGVNVGTNSTSYAVNASLAMNGDIITVTVSNAAGPTVSNEAILTVLALTIADPWTNVLYNSGMSNPRQLVSDGVDRLWLRRSTASAPYLVAINPGVPSFLGAANLGVPASGTRTPVGVACGNGITVAGGYETGSTPWFATRDAGTLNFTTRVGGVQYGGVPDFVSFGGGVFVACGWSGIHTSVDGITWTYTDATGKYGVAHAYGAGLHVLVRTNAGTAYIYTSPDAVTWTLRQTWASTDVRAVVFDGTAFVLTTWGGYYRRSVDGIAWTTPNSPGWGSHLAHGGGMIVVTGYSPVRLSSDHGLNFTNGGQAFTNGDVPVTFHGGRFYLVTGNTLYASPVV